MSWTKRKTTAFVVTAPSGAGKTTLNRRIVQELKSVELSVSTTTRECRKGETDGVHYWFVSEEEFMRRVKAGQMLEWAKVHGHYYGTSNDEMRRIEQKGLDILLEIDVQGWQQLCLSLGELVSIFILPPSLESLWERLASRGTDDLATRFRRIQNARKELEHGIDYQHFIINDDIDHAFNQLRSIIEGQPSLALDRSGGRDHCHHLLKAFDRPWFKEIEDQIRQGKK